MWRPYTVTRRWSGPAAIVAGIVRRIFGPTDRPASGYEYARMSEAGYHAPIAPRPEDAPRLVVQLANELAAAQAVDEGNGNILDGVFRAWGEQWCDEELRQHNARVSVLRLHARNARAWRDRCEERVAQLMDDLRYADAQLANLDATRGRRVAPRQRAGTEDDV